MGCDVRKSQRHPGWIRRRHGGSEDFIVWMWNADQSASMNTFLGHSVSVTCGDFTPDGETVCTGSDDATLRIWNPKSGENIHVGGVTCLTWLGKSKYLATGCGDGNVRVWDSLSGDCVRRTFSGHSNIIQGLSISTNQDFLVSISMDGTARVFEISEFC
ncbi:hypothetical protein MLD38_014144 [Melastoma candidum]|uniref:Uncharacterized protein n=1 Tax=Melastoma candidum TaxID=119954 RepID=A0ACB9RBT3_9MYRT|nr:hypothetical protein MLD38_014144 [Melastoma candidum]